MTAVSNEMTTLVTETTSPISAALSNFSVTLAQRKPRLPIPEVATKNELGHTRQNEKLIAMRLTDQAVRVWGAALLELRDRKGDADALRALLPITNGETLLAATAALAGFDSTILSHAKDCAAAASGDAGSTAFLGRQAAFAAIALANCYDDGRKQAVYDSASALLAELCSQDGLGH